MVKEKNVRRRIYGIIKPSNLCVSNVQWVHFLLPDLKPESSRLCVCSYLLTRLKILTADRRSPGPRWRADTGPTCSSSDAVGVQALAWRLSECWPGCTNSRLKRAAAVVFLIRLNKRLSGAVCRIFRTPHTQSTYMIKVLAINIGGWKCSCNQVKRAIISTEQEEAALFNQIGSDLRVWTDRSEQWLPTRWAEQQSRWPVTQHRLWRDSSLRSGWAEPDLKEVTQSV